MAHQTQKGPPPCAPTGLGLELQQHVYTGW